MNLKHLIKKMKYKNKDMMPPTSMKGMAEHAMKAMATDMEKEEDEEKEMGEEKGSKKESEIEIEIILNGAKKKKK